MVRPIEITDALSKAQEVGRMQQNAQMRPEAAQEHQKEQSEKLHNQQTHAANPVPETDQVVLHIDEQEERKRSPEEKHEERRRRAAANRNDRNSGNDASDSGHIDIKA